jgi:hypothetical protein
VCIVITACIAAAAAVGAGELSTHEDEFGIFLNIEDLGSIRKDDGSDQSYDDNQYDRNNDSVHQ